MALPARPQTFAIENCTDMLDKLDWEIDGLKNAMESDALQKMTYAAFNCAVTAWHLSDWAWADMTDEQRKPWSDLAAFGKWCREECPALHICRQIATASKHADVSRGRDEKVVLETVAEEATLRSGSRKIGLPHENVVWKLKVHTEHGATEALAVFYEAQTFWDHFILARKSDFRSTS